MKRLFASLILAACTSTLFAAGPVVEMHTSKGVIVIELDGEKAPATVANFLEYAESGFYENTVFHRVIDGFMIQGGGFDADMSQKATRAPVRNEADNGLKNEPGTIAMARTRDPHSATAQFFINLVANTALDYPSFDGYGYAVFGRVTEGFDIVQSIGRVATGTVGPFENVPREPVTIDSVRIVER
ncbi:MAG TPA: peptidylprolyl isomerase [Azoarcus taiwanensis]|nr:peptidylprolyl isomerase [Azoarcus taiwanensis]